MADAKEAIFRAIAGFEDHGRALETIFPADVIEQLSSTVMQALVDAEFSIRRNEPDAPCKPERPQPMRPDSVEVIARALAKHGGYNPDRLEPGTIPCIDGQTLTGEPGFLIWRLFASDATASLSALKDAGYAVVPVEPTEAMLEAGEASYSCGYSGTPTATPDTVYRAMLRASQEG